MSTRYANARPFGLTEAASQLRTDSWQYRRLQWPYPWVHPPENAEDVNFEGEPSGGVNPPDAYGPNNAVNLLTYTVPDGFFFALKGLMATYNAANVDGSAQVTWNVSVNVPTNAGGVTLPGLANGYAVQYLDAFRISKGSPAQPWPIRKLVFEPRDVITLSVYTQSPFPLGASNPNIYFLCGFYGWTWPEEDEAVTAALHDIAQSQRYAR